MKIILFLLCLLSIQTYCIAQSNGVSLKARYFLIQNSESQSLQMFNSSTTTRINDTLGLRQRRRVVSVREHPYEKKVGLELMASKNLELFNKLSLTLGFGLNYSSFNAQNNFGQSEFSNIGAADTIRLDPPTTSNPFCDELIRIDESTDLEGVDFNLLTLKVPVELEYSLIPNRLNFALGGYIQTPIYTKEISNSSSFESEIENGRNVCTSTTFLETNTSGDGLNNLQAGLSARIGYIIYKKIGIEVGATKDLGNIYNGASGGIFTPMFNYKPVKFFVGIVYNLGGEIESSDIDY